jgi:hypothetical protein
MAIALATLDANSITTETESDFADELTESSENLFLRNLTAIIANSERASSAKRENQLSIAEVPMSQPQPQLGYFLPISLTPRRTRRFKIRFEMIFEGTGGLLFAFVFRRAKPSEFFCAGTF